MINFIKTKNGSEYCIKINNFGKRLLFLKGGGFCFWYLPTEKEILETNDNELINIYQRLDGENNYPSMDMV
jgi:hypothetical protein